MSLEVYDGTGTAEASAGAAEKKQKRAHSIFMITVNPNKSWRDRNDPAYIKAKRRLAGRANELLGNGGMWNFIRFISGDQSSVERVRMAAGLEMGERADKLHIHIMLHIEHRAMIRLEIEKLRDAFREVFEGCYLFSKVYSNRADGLENYIKKGFPGGLNNLAEVNMDTGQMTGQRIGGAGNDAAGAGPGSAEAGESRRETNASGVADPRPRPSKWVAAVVNRPDSIDYACKIINTAMAKPGVRREVASAHGEFMAAEASLIEAGNSGNPQRPSRDIVKAAVAYAGKLLRLVAAIEGAVCEAEVAVDANGAAEMAAGLAHEAIGAYWPAPARR